MKLLFLCITIILSLQNANADEMNTVDLKKLSDGTSLLKIPMNYKDTSIKQTKVKNAQGVFYSNFSLPNKWEIIDAKGFVQYHPSSVLLKDLSTITLSFNDVFVAKYQLFDHVEDGIHFKLDPDLFMTHNSVAFDIDQHYTKECENSIEPILWTEIDLNASYIQLHVRPKAVKEEIASIKSTLFDDTQYKMTPVNFVVEQTDEETLHHLALLTATIATKLNARSNKMMVSNDIAPDMHNIIINTKQKTKEYLSIFNELNSSNTDTTLSFENKLHHDINIIQNPYDISKAILAITPEDSSKIDQIIYSLYQKDLGQYRDQGLNITKVQMPSPLEGYSAKNFVPVDEKIYFKDLGFKTTLLQGWYPPKVKIQFKVYPDHHFNSKDMIETRIHYLFPTLIHEDSIVNLTMNNFFVDQVNIVKSAKKANIKMDSHKLFNFDSNEDIPSVLLNKGVNELKLDLSLVALREGECDAYDTNSLVATVFDDSYFILPKSKRWVELPYMQLIKDAQYPYSIYPDLQDTVIYLADSNPYTLSSALNFIFFLTQEIGSFPTHIRMSTKLTSQDKQKHIIAFGTIENEEIQRLSKNAPMEFASKNIKGNYPGLYNFLKEGKNLWSTKIIDKYKLLTSINGPLLPENTLLMQMFRSVFNTEKSILFFVSNDPLSLNHGVYSLLQDNNRNLIQGDLLIYDYKNQNGVTFNIKEKYILSDMNWFETLLLKIGFNPLTYMIVLFLALFLMVSITKLYLKKFQEEHHPDV